MKKKNGQAGKIVSIIFCTLCAILTVIQIGTVIAMGGFGVYTHSKENRKEMEADAYAWRVEADIFMLLGNCKNSLPAQEELKAWYEDTNFNYYLYADGGNSVLNIENGASGGKHEWIIEHGDGYYYYNGTKHEDGIDAEYTLVICMLDEIIYKDDIYTTYKLLDIAYTIRYGIFATLVFSLIGTIVSFVYLMKHAGKKDEDGVLVLRWVDKIPFDLFTILTFAADVAIFLILVEGIRYSYDVVERTLYTVAAVGAAIPVNLLFILSCIVRHKTKTMWKNTCIGWLGRKIASCFRYVRAHIPFIWKGLLIAGGICLLELFLFVAEVSLGYRYSALPMVLFFLEKAVLIAAFAIALANLNQLKKAGEQIAAGGYNQAIDTGKMFWDFKQYGETLNHITEGMQTALEERMKSEHFKTELITNVSHDIKTPLTSIINYVDLLSKEDLNDPKVTEYLEVLTRQSARLKKLIEDLIEASKASTGTLKVNWENCEPEVLLTQAAGEYEERLNQKNLELIVHAPEEGFTIRADGRHLWRVFDNLLNNIYKYAQPGTRVYLDMEKRDGKVAILFRNTSGSPLHMSGDELRERFVRGDSSRNTEGSGLGLSIAESLTELMGGKMELVIDGDLFKVLLTFPCQKSVTFPQNAEVSPS